MKKHMRLIPTTEYHYMVLENPPNIIIIGHEANDSFKKYRSWFYDMDFLAVKSPTMGITAMWNQCFSDVVLLFRM